MWLGNDELHHLIAIHPTEPNDPLVLAYPFLERSLYDLHDDVSGVSMASWNRPIVSLEPAAKDFLANGPRNFQADLYIIGWLERSGLGYEIITDDDPHAEGAAALEPYGAIVTGSHPEYWSRRMMDGLQDYLMGGGIVPEVAEVAWTAPKVCTALRLSDPGPSPLLLQPA